MENKEIEELLNKLHKLLLLYIEQLEEELKQEKKDYKETNDKCFELINENKQLKNNRDKAIEQCNDWIKIYKKLNSDERIILRLEEISRTLKGDSDE